ncbi:MAG: acetoacetate--CoA ligase [Burkholderiaceae bacterium]|nr:acetoacetate--CoA ligase [Burkholderiaceae bacterium]
MKLRTDLEPAHVREGELLWTPDPQQAANTRIAEYMRWLSRERGLAFEDYAALYRWSVDDLDAFWKSIFEYFDVRSSTPVGAVLGRREMPGAQWFPGVRLNYAEHVLRNERAGEDALLYLDETRPLAGFSWDALGAQVRTLATRLREMGVVPGDRVVAYLPNVPEAVVAMLATTAIGAIWSSVSPDFGASGALDRIAQLQPKVLFCVDGYRYGGKVYDRGSELRAIVSGLDDLGHVVVLPRLGGKLPAFERAGLDVRTWEALVGGEPVAAADFRFEQVAFDHPLWILFSSGTTGLPKAIVHGHGGILLEMLKLVALHMDLRAGERMFFFSTTGWMMWNFLASSMLCGVVPVLYDGHPAYPDVDVLWRMAQDSGASFFGASPTYVDILSKAGVVPGERYDLSRLRAIMPAGSPVSPAHTAWFYRNVKADLWVCSGSGGTDVCTGFVGGVPTQPVYAGEIQAPHLGVSAQAWNDAGESVVDEVGELVITQPMPSMPVKFWNDPDGSRYRDSYFGVFSGVWRQGDFFRINARGGCFVLGRSDATLNRHGVRIGTAEIYRALATLPEIDDALIVNLDLPGGRFFMPLFVKLRAGATFDDALVTRIGERLRDACTPRHVPDKVYRVDAIPATLTGKKMEVPVRRILQGMPAERAANRSAMADPSALDWFVGYAAAQTDYVRFDA